MKNLIQLLIFTLGIGLVAEVHAKPSTVTSKRVCDALQTKIDDDCAHMVCDKAIAEGTFNDINECTSGADYAEYAQGACDGQPTLEDLVAEYNRKHPKTKIKCD